MFGSIGICFPVPFGPFSSRECVRARTSGEKALHFIGSVDGHPHQFDLFADVSVGRRRTGQIKRSERQCGRAREAILGKHLQVDEQRASTRD